MGVVIIPFVIENFTDEHEIPKETKSSSINYIINYNYSCGSYHFIRKLISYREKEFEFHQSIENDHRIIKVYGFESHEVNKDLCNEIYTIFIGLDDWDNNIRNQSAHISLGRVLKLVDPAIEPELPQLTVPEIAILEVKQKLATLNINRPYVCFCPGAGSSYKRWSLENFIKVAEELIFSYSCIFIFGPDEKELQNEFENIYKSNGITAITDISIPQLAALFSLAILNITNDSGPMHIGCAVGCNTVALFGSTNSKEWFPYKGKKNIVIEKNCASYETCNYCTLRDNCIQNITIDEVIATTLSLLNSNVLGLVPRRLQQIRNNSLRSSARR